MATSIGLVIDCADPGLLSAFWVQALHYEVQQPPDGSATWADYWRARGMSEEELAEFDDDGGGYDVIVDPDGAGPRIWFQPVPEGKTVKNRIHLDLFVSGGRAKPLEERIPAVDAEVERRRGPRRDRVRAAADRGAGPLRRRDCRTPRATSSASPDGQTRGAGLTARVDTSHAVRGR